MSPRIKNKTKPLFGAILTGALALGGLSTNTFASTPITDLMEETGMTDQAFATCVYNAYHDTTGKYFHELDYDFDYPTELAKITTLSCPNQGIADVTGLYLLTNLEKLDLTDDAITGINVSSNQKLTSLKATTDLVNWHGLLTIDISNNPDIVELYISNLGSGGLKTSAYLEKSDNDEYDYMFDLSNLKFWTDSDFQTNSNQYYDANNKKVYTKTNDSNSSWKHVTYGNTRILPREGTYYGKIYIENEDGDYELFSPFYYGPVYAVYAGDAFDTDDELEKIYDYAYTSDGVEKRFGDIAENYKLTNITLAVTNGSFYRAINEQTHITGAYGPDATVTANYYFELKTDEDTPTAPNTGFFTNEDGGVNLANIAALLAVISVIAFLSLGITFRIRKYHKASRF